MSSDHPQKVKLKTTRLKSGFLRFRKEKRLEEKCGIVGLFTTHYTASLPLALSAANGVQHRGQQGTGLALKTKKRLITYKNNGLVNEVFTAAKIKKFNQRSQWILVHCRYGTNGAYRKENLQPCVVTTLNGEQIAVIHNGEFASPAEINKKLKKPLPRGTSDTYLFAQFLAQTPGKNWEEKILAALSQINGAYSLIITVDGKMFVARDEFGIRPLVIGKMNGGWLVASETYALDKVGIKLTREIKKGEVVCIDKIGIKTIRKESTANHHFCDFEWAYFSKPNSLLPTNETKRMNQNPEEWLAVAAFRERCGNIVAKESPVNNATFVVGVPDSGISFATAYAHSLNLSYRQIIIRDHFDPHGIQRLFMRDDEKSLIGRKVLGKLALVPDRHIWKDAIAVIGDDSIVRGNVSQQITKAIFALGAKEVHWIIGYPPVMHRCHLGVSIRTREELIAPHNGGDPKKIAKEIGATSVNYISNRGFIQARLLQTKLVEPKNSKEIFLKNGGCGGCVTGLYPVDRAGQVYKLNGHR